MMELRFNAGTDDVEIVDEDGRAVARGRIVPDSIPLGAFAGLAIRTSLSFIGETINPDGEGEGPG